MITIVDYQVGNVGSIANMLSRGGFESRITADPREIEKAEKLILPGVGAFDHGMRQLAALRLAEPLHTCASVRRVPILGICLGFQLMARASEEGGLPGLGWLNGTVVRFRFGGEHPQLPLPHMGWNDVRPTSTATLFAGLAEAPRFYFVHSYHFVCGDDGDTAATAAYGYRFAAAVERENLFGVQFHPEKSHRFGLGLLTAFAQLR